LNHRRKAKHNAPWPTPAPGALRQSAHRPADKSPRMVKNDLRPVRSPYAQVQWR
jgi:hypothetical protein